MINYIYNKKAITLTSENNPKTVQQSIIHKNYTHIFISFEITLSKKFKANMLNDFCFAS